MEEQFITVHIPKESIPQICSIAGGQCANANDPFTVCGRFYK